MTSGLMEGLHAFEVMANFGSICMSTLSSVSSTAWHRGEMINAEEIDGPDVPTDGPGPGRIL